MSGAIDHGFEDEAEVEQLLRAQSAQTKVSSLSE